MPHRTQQTPIGGGSYIGTRPSKASVKGICSRIGEQTAAGMTLGGDGRQGNGFPQETAPSLSTATFAIVPGSLDMRGSLAAVGRAMGLRS